MDPEIQNTEERNPVKTEKVDEVMEVIEHIENSAQDLVSFFFIWKFPTDLAILWLFGDIWEGQFLIWKDRKI